MTEKYSKTFQFFRRKRRSGLSDNAISGLLDIDDLYDSDISGGSDDSNVDATYLPESLSDVDPDSSDNDEIIQVQPDFGDQHEPEAAGEHGQGHPPQLDAALSSDKDGVGEPPKSAGSKRYVIANR